MQEPILKPCPDDMGEWIVKDTDGETYCYADFSWATRVFLAFVHVWKLAVWPEFDGYDPIEELDLIGELNELPG